MVGSKQIVFNLYNNSEELLRKHRYTSVEGTKGDHSLYSKSYSTNLNTDRLSSREVYMECETFDKYTKANMLTRVMCYFMTQFPVFPL